MEAAAGLDARYRITSNLTLTATANPDFGQVEVDPAVINLTAFETRFEERRPFFVEGASSFRFGGTVGGPSAAAASVLYTRRIGRAPQLGVGTTDTDMPVTATIIGAGKVAGKTAERMVGRRAERAHRRRARTVPGFARLDPARVGRAAHELLRQPREPRAPARPDPNRRHRHDDQPRADERRAGGRAARRARTAAAWTSCTSGRTAAGTSADFSSAAASPAARRRCSPTQRSSTRYYQRPDATHVRDRSDRDVHERRGRVGPDAKGRGPALDDRQLDAVRVARVRDQRHRVSAAIRSARLRPRHDVQPAHARQASGATGARPTT